MSSCWADAAVAANAIDAGGSSLAGLRRALIHIDAAVRTGESLGADAAEPARSRLAGAAIVARLSAALVNGLVAEKTRPTGCTAAMRLQSLVRRSGHAGSAILALTGITASGPLRAALTCTEKN